MGNLGKIAAIAVATAAGPLAAEGYSGFSVFAGAAIGFGEFDDELFDETFTIEEGRFLNGGVAYDFDFGGIIAGGVLQILNGSAVVETVDGDSDTTLTLIGARGGVVAGPGYAYGTAGLSTGEIDLDGTVSDLEGGFIGAGYEVLVTGNITASTEILFHNFPDVDDVEDLNATLTTVSGRVGFRF